MELLNPFLLGTLLLLGLGALALTLGVDSREGFGEACAGSEREGIL